jgi:hypothetical protein
MFYGIIPEHIVDSTSITTKKTNRFEVLGRNYKYYSVKLDLFFGYKLMSITINGSVRNILMADKEKAILDLIYLFNFYKTQSDIEELRLNENIMGSEFDWVKMDYYTRRFNSKILTEKVEILKKIFKYD